MFSVEGLCGNWTAGFCAWKMRALPFGETHLVWSRLRIWKHLFLEKALVCFHEEGLKNKSMKSPFFFPDQYGLHYERSFLIAPLCHVMSIPLSPLWQGKRCIINLQISKVDVIFIQRRRSLTAGGFVWAWPRWDGTSLEQRDWVNK